MKRPKLSKEGMTISINTTEYCNLACVYCYEICKKPKTIKIEDVKKFFELVLTNIKIPKEKDRDGLYNGVIIDLIGGDALMKPDLCDQILTTWIDVVWSIDTPFAKRCRINWACSISTNGTLFENPKVREFCLKWKSVLSIGISIDGCPELHDLNRPFVGGGGSMSTILKWRPWIKENFPFTYEETKSTLAKNSIPYIFESLKWMYNNGITYINQNFIMEENFCTEKDYKELIHQLQMCIDWILETPGVDNDIYWSLLDKPKCENKRTSDGEWNTHSQCGSGKMPCLSIDGNVYPCFRWLPHTNDSGVGKYACGNIHNMSFFPEKFKEVQDGGIRCNCSKDPKCRDCIYESNCPYCIGGCYAEFGEFRRTTYICTITKIECEMAKRYWNRYNKKHNINERYEEYELPV